MFIIKQYFWGRFRSQRCLRGDCKWKRLHFLPSSNKRSRSRNCKKLWLSTVGCRLSCTVRLKLFEFRGLWLESHRSLFFSIEEVFFLNFWVLNWASSNVKYLVCFIYVNIKNSVFIRQKGNKQNTVWIKHYRKTWFEHKQRNHLTK